MKLYYNPISTYSQKVLIAFYEKGLEFEANVVNLMAPDERAKYREVYPLGKVPCLIIDDDHLIPESSIIIEYIDSLAEPRLIEGDTEATRKIRFKDRMFDLYLNDSVVTLLFQGMKPEEQQDRERIETAQFRIDTMYGFMEHELGDRSFANGEKFTMADCAAAPALFYAEQTAPFSDHKNISAYWERLKERPSIQRTHEEARPVLEAFMSKDAA
ncbi:MAG: glutathione S-transferase family protein [Woeseia sp.]